MNRLLPFCLALCIMWHAQGQNTDEIDLEAFAERLFQVQDDDLPYDDLYESLLMYHTSPIPLQRTDYAQLASLHILSPLQLSSFFQYREQHGRLLSIYELQAIPHFDLHTIRMLLPFVTVDERTDSRPLLQRILNERNNYLFGRYARMLEPPSGYQRPDRTGYLGQPAALYHRFRVSHPGDFSVGFTMEKDPGEPWQIQPSQRQYGFDFYSAHFFLENQGRFKKIALGDFQLQFGQGLVFGAGFSAGKGAETTNSVKRNSSGLRPYTSALESGFFRGAGFTLQSGKLETTLFASFLRQDATLRTDSSFTETEAFVNSIQATGLHRTASELAARNTTGETLLGMAIRYPINHQLVIGATSLYSRYSVPLLRSPNRYNQFEFNGQVNAVGSVYGQYYWQNAVLFGEAARSRSGGLALIGGAVVSLTHTLDFSLVSRRYDRDFHSFYGNAFAENSRVINEHGTYWGLKYHPNRRHQWAAYFDRFTFPWLRYRVDAPSQGYEWLSRYSFFPSKTATAYLQYREQHKGINLPGDHLLPMVGMGIKRNFVINADYQVGRSLALKSRVQGSTYTLAGQTTTGMAIAQDITVSLRRWRFSGRIALFETEDFTNAQYLFEKDLLYTFSVPAYHGTGVRSYLLAQFRATKALTLWVKYGRFRYEGVESVGTGMAKTDGPTRSEIKAMVRYRVW